MKKFMFLVLMLVSFSSVAQDSIVVPVIKNNHEQFKLFYGAGTLYTNHFNINNFLSKNNIVLLGNFEINGIFGVEYFNDNIDIDLGYEVSAIGNSIEITKYRSRSNGIKFRCHYEILKIKKTWISAGFNIGYSKRVLDIYWKNFDVDFNSTNIIAYGNQLRMHLEKSYLGPSVSLKFKESGRSFQQTKFTLAYEFALNNKQWESIFFNLQNKITEPNQTQIIMNVSFNL